MSRHPIQPLEMDTHGVLRFKENAIVRTLLDAGHLDLNAIARMDFSDDDRQQFAQLIGYSLSGYGELRYVSSDAYAVASAMADRVTAEGVARTLHLETELATLRAALREPMARLFGIHPDDLHG